MRFLETSLIDRFIEMAITANRLGVAMHVSENDAGTDEESVTITFTGEATVTVRNQLPILDGGNCAVVMTYVAVDGKEITRRKKLS